MPKAQVWLDGDHGSLGKILRPDFDWGITEDGSFVGTGLISSAIGASSSSITRSSIRIDCDFVVHSVVSDFFCFSLLQMFS